MEGLWHHRLLSKNRAWNEQQNLPAGRHRASRGGSAAVTGALGNVNMDSKPVLTQTFKMGKICGGTVSP